MPRFREEGGEGVEASNGFFEGTSQERVRVGSSQAQRVTSAGFCIRVHICIGCICGHICIPLFASLFTFLLSLFLSSESQNSVGVGILE